MTVRSNVATRFRLASGLVLMPICSTIRPVSTHWPPWKPRQDLLGGLHTAPATSLLYAAFAAHITLAVHKLWRRRSLRMPPWQLVQVVLGFLIPSWPIAHVVGTRGAQVAFGVDDSYARVLNALWPDGALRQSLMLVLVWLHGCIGIHFWLRLRPWYPAMQPWLSAFAVLLPTLALIGFATWSPRPASPSARASTWAAPRSGRSRSAVAAARCACVWSPTPGRCRSSSGRTSPQGDACPRAAAQCGPARAAPGAMTSPRPGGLLQRTS